MKVYLVRHGQTNENSKFIHQNSEASLSKLGIKQAEKLTERVKHIKIDLIITSPFKRTMQTTNIINNVLNKPVIESELLIEIKRPTEIEGLSAYDDKALDIKNLIKSNLHNPRYKHSDEETYEELIKRSRVALNFISKQNAENILVVTHGELIRSLIGVILLNDSFTSQLLLKFNDHLKSHNSGITMCEYKDKNWKLLTWNDHAHLG